MAEAPYRDELPPVEVTVDTGGSGTFIYRVTGRVLTAERTDKPGTKTIALADVTRVELATLGGTTICTVEAGATKISVSSGMEAMAKGSERERAFFGFLEPLNERISLAAPQAQFVAGSWAVVGGLAIVNVLLVGLVAWMSQTSLRDSWKFTLALVMVGVSLVVALPMAIVRGRPKPYDPRKLPRVYDPLAGGA